LLGHCSSTQAERQFIQVTFASGIETRK
jgi:hypothetical protein